MGLARRYLEARNDHALGLAPVRLLPPKKAAAWILFWTAARRVDDFVEQGVRGVDEWRRSLDEGRNETLGERCMQAFLHRPEGAGTRQDLQALLHRGLDGLAKEAGFRAPRPLAEYLDLIRDKSATAMRILDHLLFPGESEARIAAHAEAFAATTQVGDDCRDALRDLEAGRCFVTQEELAGTEVRAYVADPRFARVRAAMCRYLLDRADAAASAFRVEAHKALAQRLSDFWSHAIGSGQIRATDKPLELPQGEPVAAPGLVALPSGIEAVLERRF